MGYPEHEKLRAVRDTSQVIGAFIEWLEETGRTVAKWMPHYGDNALQPECAKTEALLAEYFGIDLQRLEAEKRAMVEELQALAS